MAKVNPKTDRYYPDRSAFKTHEEWYAHVETYNNVYAMQDKLEEITKTIQQHASDIQANTSNIRRVGIVNNINGLAIKASVPSNGQKLTYNATTGQIEWQ